LALIENIQRQELNPIEEAQAYKKLIDTLGLTQEMVAQRVGRDRTFITNYIRLLRLPEDIQRLLEQEKISMGHARALLSVDDVEIQRKLAQNVIDQALSVRETERAIRKIIEGSSAVASTIKTQPQNDANIRAAESKLRRKFSSQVRIISNQNGEGGKIEIEFYSENDLQRVYQLLMASQ
jgi:ParB family chromosome partitioning protein